ncbi:unnamed protein product, partial [Amoebophrya sp. A25]
RNERPVFPNYSFGFGSYEGGELFIYDPKGKRDWTVPEGMALDLKGSGDNNSNQKIMHSYQAGDKIPGKYHETRHRWSEFLGVKLPHATCPWKNGDRYLLAAYWKDKDFISDEIREKSLQFWKSRNFLLPPAISSASCSSSSLDLEGLRVCNREQSSAGTRTRKAEPEQETMPEAEQSRLREIASEEMEQ